jgi:hypothetical protein
MKKKIKIRIDPLTGERFLPSRNHQRFARKENRIKFWNDKANAQREKLSDVNYALHRNVYLLNKLLYRKRELTTTRAYLLGLGFSFDVFTGLTENKKYKKVYHYVIMPLNKTNIKIIKNDE